MIKAILQKFQKNSQTVHQSSFAVFIVSGILFSLKTYVFISAIYNDLCYDSEGVKYFNVKIFKDS